MAKKPSEFELAMANALRIKAEAAAERARLEREEAEADEFIRLYQKFAPKPEVEAAEVAEVEFNAKHAEKLKRFVEVPFSTTGEIQEAARAYLRELGQPASIRMIFETLQLRGIRIPGQNPIMNLSSKLNTSKDMVFTKDVGWWFRPPSEPVPAPRGLL